MWNFQRIICIWICCVSCMFGTTQLSTLVAAVPYEYFDDHDQSFYDLDTEQIQAKYDTRLLSQQMLKTPEQQQQILENQKGSHPGVGFGDGLEDVGTNERVRGASFVLDNNKRNEDAAGSSDILTKLKTNDASKSTNSNSNANTNTNNNIYDGSNKDNAWIDETTAAITEKQEIHLPRAASCYTNGQKYTHGQKVPRHDSCEVCLCMDGEIFCWWEKCDKKTPKGQTPPRYEEDYSTPYGESSTMRILANEKSTVRTTLRPMKKPKINKDYKYGQAEVDGEEDLDGDEERDNVNDGDDAAAPDEDNEYDDITQRHGKRPYKSHNKQQMTKKKSYIGGEHKEALELKEKQMKMKKEKLKKQQQQKQQEKHKGNNDHHQYHHPEHRASSGSSSKILNFPENLPSVLYYDYKTEEHQHHQHQHREQHLKHQHEKELKHRQHSGSRHHEYGGVGGGDSDGQDFNADTSVTMPAVATSLVASASAAGSGNDVVLHRQQQQQPPSSSAKYLGNGNDNIYNVDLQTDSDILPEPPTKKPKLPSIATEMASAVALDSASALASASAAAAETPTTTLSYRLSTLSATSAATTTNITTRPLKKQMFSPWDYGKPNRDKVNKSINQRRQPSNKAAGIDAGLAPASDGGEDQDDAFHRWLTSTEKNNKNNGPQMGDADDFEGDDKNYENIDIDIDAVSLQGTAKTPVPASPPIAGDEAGHEVAQQLANSGNLKYEINFSDNPNGYPATGTNGNSNNDNNNNGNENDNEDNISPFSNPYQNYKNNNSPTLNNRSGAQSQYGSISTRTSTGPLSSSSSTSSSSSSSSNEDNGVGSVVNIDIMLTASADMAQQQQQQPFPVPGSLEHDKLNQPLQPNAKQKSLLISNTNGKDNEPLSQFSSSAIGNANNSFDVVVGGDSPQQTLAGGSNLLSSNFSSSDGGSNNISSNSNSNSQSNSFSDSFKLSPALVSNSTATSSVASASSAQTTPPTSTTLSPERQCNVMGTLYKIGDVLPQDTGNCLQCICIDGSTMDDTPRVTCSPHNCPPLVLPDLFDATGY